jgi:hypothetical protein
MQLSLDCPFWYFLSTGSQLIYQSSTGKMWKRYRKSYIFLQVTAYNENLSIQYNMAAQLEQEVSNKLRLQWVYILLSLFMDCPFLNSILRARLNEDCFYIKTVALVWFMVFKATFNNISVISWQSVLLVEETRVPRENHPPVASHW